MDVDSAEDGISITAVVAVHATIRCYIGEEGWRYHHDDEIERCTRSYHHRRSYLLYTDAAPLYVPLLPKLPLLLLLLLTSKACAADVI